MANRNFSTFNVEGTLMQFDDKKFKSLFMEYCFTKDGKKKRKIGDVENDLAKKVNISPEAVHQWRAGNNGPSSLDIIEKIASFFGLESFRILLCEIINAHGNKKTSSSNNINKNNESTKLDDTIYPYPLIQKGTINYCNAAAPTLFDKYGKSSLYNINRHNRYKPLNTRYKNTCSTEAKMILEDKNTRFVLKAYNSGSLYLETYDDSIYIPLLTRYSNIEETGEFRNCYKELLKMADEGIKKTDAIFNDSKNFSQRISAKVINSDLHVFIEKFNYNLPMANEYYLMDYYNGQYTMTVSHSSGFMKKYLSNEEYSKKYGIDSYKVIAEYTSIDEINAEISNDHDEIEIDSLGLYFEITSESTELNNQTEKTEDSEEDFYSKMIDTNNVLYFWRHNYFLHLKKEINNFIRLLKNGKEYIENPDIFQERENDIISFFNVENKFECTFGPDTYAMEALQQIMNEINEAIDVDTSFDFDAEFERLIKTSSKESVQSQIESPFNDISEVTKAYIKLKLKQGKKLQDFTLFNRFNDEWNKKIVEVGNPTPTFILSNGNEVKLSVQDLIRGFRLGLNNIEEIGKLKLKHNSLKIKDLI